MFTARNFIYSAVALSVISCGGSSSSDNSNDLELPSFVSLIQEQQTASPSKNFSAKSALSQVVPLAVADPLPGAGTDFDNFTTTNLGVDEHPGGAIFKVVNGALCFVGQTNPQANVGALPYRSLVDEGKCFEEDNTSYKDVISQVTELASGYQIDLWWTTSRGGDNFNVTVRFLINESISDANPYGRFEYFKLDKNSNDNISVKQHLVVDVDSSAAEPYHVFKVTNDGVGELSSKLVAKTAINGSAGGAVIRDRGNEADVIFNSDFIQHNQVNPEVDVCFDRADPIEKVYGYALFNLDGSAFNLESGFGFSYSIGESTTNGIVDKYGVWPEDLFTVAGTYTVTRHSNNETYTLTVDGSGNAAVKDSGNNTVEFGDPIEFTGIEIGTVDLRNDESEPADQTMTYYGRGSMGNSSVYNLVDGYILGTYLVKATDISLSAEESENQESCDILDDYPTYTAEFDSLAVGDDSSYNTAAAPTITAAPKYVAGEAVVVPTDL
ncbi:hypothetical protein [Pelagibaculum spongiae]|uniref:Lipoprotein n=1 Tax=Pelagibaculum spongiae TaxID=2080658 RepID=A0A2V1GUQ4_9GAMM|nr:hypothetical protein [Pelagibaculum spongiae]PVZ67770.1 hypothetical protein DC094_15165 [Pelagibaculum spongiae]